MPEFTVTVRDDNLPTLTALAHQQWRDEQQQLCALVEQALTRAGGDTARRTRGTRRTRTNGVARLPVEAAV